MEAEKEGILSPLSDEIRRSQRYFIVIPIEDETCDLRDLDMMANSIDCLLFDHASETEGSELGEGYALLTVLLPPSESATEWADAFLDLCDHNGIAPADRYLILRHMPTEREIGEFLGNA